MSSPLSDDEAAAIIEAQLGLTVRALAGHSTDLDVGWAVQTNELPLVWTLNQLCVTERASPDVLFDAAEDAQRRLPYRHVVVRHRASAEAAVASAQARGWRVERDVLMALDRATARKHPIGEVAELTEDQALELMGSWLCEEREMSEDGLAQVLEYNRREGALWHEQRLGILDDDGTPLAITKLRVDGSFGWVEDVYALPRSRGRGHGRTLVAEAVRRALASGCSLVAIVADADDWPQQLYASVGFRPVGAAWILHGDASAPER
jgi:GNAT superfamily N-acetyltransferase